MRRRRVPPAHALRARTLIHQIRVHIVRIIRRRLLRTLVVLFFRVMVLHEMVMMRQIPNF